MIVAFPSRPSHRKEQYLSSGRYQSKAGQRFRAVRQSPAQSPGARNFIGGFWFANTAMRHNVCAAIFRFIRGAPIRLDDGVHSGVTAELLLLAQDVEMRRRSQLNDEGLCSILLMCLRPEVDPKNPTCQSSICPHLCTFDSEDTAGIQSLKGALRPSGLLLPVDLA